MVLMSLVVALALAGGPDSGLPVGSEAPAFDPRHVWGPDRGTSACPMCKYGGGQGVLIWVNADDPSGVTPLAARLERAIREKGPRRIRAFVIYTNPAGRPPGEVEDRLRAFAAKAGLDQVAVAYVPSPTDPATSAAYHINPDSGVKNTVLVYCRRRVTARFVNLGMDRDSLDVVVREVELAARAR